MVPHPCQNGVPPGALRFVISLRATGEGHISSITFRSGLIHSANQVEVDPPKGFLTDPRQVPNAMYEKALFVRKLFELGFHSELVRRVMARLGESFALAELRSSLKRKCGALCYRMAWRTKIKIPRTESGCWPAPISRFGSNRSKRSPNASCSPPPPRKATALRTPVSSVRR